MSLKIIALSNLTYLITYFCKLIALKFCRRYLLWCCWKSVLCCTWGTAEALWTRSRCVECWCHLIHFVEWSSAFLGRCIIIHVDFWFYQANIQHLNLLIVWDNKLPYCTFCHFQKLKQGFSDRYYKVVWILNLNHGLAYLIAQRI